MQILRFGLYLCQRGLYTSKPAPGRPGFLITSEIEKLLVILGLGQSTLLKGFSDREELWTWLEGASIRGYLLRYGWRSAPVREGDEMLQAWAKRRQGEPRIDLDRVALLIELLEAQGLTDQYSAWLESTKAQIKEIAEARERKEAITAEIRRRMEASPARGKGRKTAAGQIRQEVEATFHLHS